MPRLHFGQSDVWLSYNFCSLNSAEEVGLCFKVWNLVIPASQIKMRNETKLLFAYCDTFSELRSFFPFSAARQSEPIATRDRYIK